MVHISFTFCVFIYILYSINLRVTDKLYVWVQTVALPAVQSDLDLVN